MIGVNDREFPAEVLGSIDENHDYNETVDRVVLAGLVQRERNQKYLQRARFFAGSVATQEVFDAVAAVEGVASLEFEQTVYAANPLT